MSVPDSTRPWAYLVEDVVVALGIVHCHDAAAFQKVRADGSPRDHTLAIEVDLHVLAKAGAVVVAHRLGIAKGLQQRVGFQHLPGGAGRARSRKHAFAIGACLHRMCLHSRARMPKCMAPTKDAICSMRTCICPHRHKATRASTHRSVRFVPHAAAHIKLLTACRQDHSLMRGACSPYHQQSLSMQLQLAQLTLEALHLLMWVQPVHTLICAYAMELYTQPAARPFCCGSSTARNNLHHFTCSFSLLLPAPAHENTPAPPHSYCQSQAWPPPRLYPCNPPCGPGTS